MIWASLELEDLRTLELPWTPLGGLLGHVEAILGRLGCILGRLGGIRGSS